MFILNKKINTSEPPLDTHGLICLNFFFKIILSYFSEKITHFNEINNSALYSMP